MIDFSQIFHSNDDINFEIRREIIKISIVSHDRKCKRTILEQKSTVN